MSRNSRGTLPGAEHTLFGGYGPFVALVALMLAMALLAPTVAPERDVTTRRNATPAAEHPRSGPDPALFSDGRVSDLNAESREAGR